MDRQIGRAVAALGLGAERDARKPPPLAVLIATASGTNTSVRRRSPRPSAIMIPVAFGDNWMPAPVLFQPLGLLQQCDAEAGSRQHQRRAQPPDTGAGDDDVARRRHGPGAEGQTASVRAQASGRAAWGSSAGSCRYSVEQYGQMISLSSPMSRKT